MLIKDGYAKIILQIIWVSDMSVPAKSLRQAFHL